MTHLRQPSHAALAAPAGCPKPTRKPFTLVELLVAMAVLALIMLMLFQFFAAAQNVWSLSAASMRIYENARVATELMERDLQCVLIVDSIYDPDDVPFYIHSDDKITFVSPVRDDDASDSRLAEVTYRLEGSELQRQEIGDENALWDFHLTPYPPANWADNGTSNFEPVIGGVGSLLIEAFRASASPPYFAAYGTGTSNERPETVRITLTIYDERLDSIPIVQIGVAEKQKRVDRSKRTFTKTIYLRK